MLMTRHPTLPGSPEPVYAHDSAPDIAWESGARVYRMTRHPTLPGSRRSPCMLMPGSRHPTLPGSPEPVYTDDSAPDAA
jgi:hypothetical protein